VGIGTTPSSFKLDARSDTPAFFGATNGDGTRYGFTSALPSNSGNCYVGWIPETIGTGGVNGDLGLCPRTSAGANIRFFTGTTTASERMRITSSGATRLQNTIANGAYVDSGSTVSIANSGTITMASGVCGAMLVCVYEQNSGAGGLFFANYESAVVRVAGTGETTDTGGSYALYKSAFSHTLTFKNRSGSTRSFSIAVYAANAF
jgi:hypothetical protein